ncbi:MAG: DNA mismatch repair endonuclease MutL [Spirochaetaceae bacterium]|nr:MAG: DNA mismatch repair endonuclease MutL [Spirochaetaceae bacterium]
MGGVESNTIALLPPEVSRRIAAGEVIEKPASVVRELLDNALDAGATMVDVTWTEGGSESIRVRDDGNGMSREDLELCWKPHATSKIRTLEDLDHSRSLGFRGEALASIAAVSELTIESTLPGDHHGHRLEVRQAEYIGITPAPPRPGTSVTVQRLFANLPARRRFLSRAQAESQVIRNTILEKALPFPEVRFTMPGPGTSVRALPAGTLAERTAEVYGSACPLQALTELHGTGEGFSCTILAAHPEIIRRDRRLISVYVNRRRVTEYKLVQAVEYAYQDVQHGGIFPVAALLIDVDPELADFNIHPAKREVRLRNIGEIHHRVVEILRSHLRTYTVRAARWPAGTREEGLWDPPPAGAPSGVGESAGGAGGSGGQEYRVPPGRAPGGPGGSGGAPRRSAPGSLPRVGRPASFEHTRRAVPDDSIRFHGTAFGTYNIVERGDRLFIIDQHAVHERLHYDRLKSDRVPQPLLIPEEFTASPDQDKALQAHSEEYRRLGLLLERCGEERWRITAIPGAYRTAIEDLIEMILDLGGLQEQLDRTFLARLACRAALKAGDHLDSITGEELARRALDLPEPRCPHGRPLWVELDREQLDRLIGRR